MVKGRVLTATLTEGNRVRIPKEIVNKLKLENGMPIIFEIHKGYVYLIPGKVVPKVVSK